MPIIIRVTAKYSAEEDGFWVKLSCNEPDSFYDGISLLKLIIPAVDREYDPDQKSWLIYGRDHLMKWCDALGKLGEVLLDFPAASQGRPIPENASLFNELYVTPDAPIDVIKASYKALARLHHPDLVGDVGHERMIVINNAYLRIVEDYNQK